MLSLLVVLAMLGGRIFDGEPTPIPMIQDPPEVTESTPEPILNEDIVLPTPPEWLGTDSHYVEDSGLFGKDSNGDKVQLILVYGCTDPEAVDYIGMKSDSVTKVISVKSECHYLDNRQENETHSRRKESTELVIVPKEEVETPELVYILTLDETDLFGL